jgi:phosphinothricin acetyltransferase
VTVYGTFLYYFNFPKVFYVLIYFLLYSLKKKKKRNMGNPLELYTIRAAVENDLPQVLEIYNERIMNSTCLFMYDPVALENRTTWFLETKAKGYPIIVAAEKKTNKAIAYANYGGFRPQTAFVL